MKRITFNNSNGSSGHNPFWNPWGFLGYMGRFLGFLALMFLLFVGLTAIRSCNDSTPPDIPDDILRPPGTPDPDDKDKTRGITDPIDTIPENPFRTDIPDPGPYLPDSTRNFIPPVEPGDTIEDPDTGEKKAGDRLNVILDSKSDDSTFKQWAKEFKTLYPDDEYEITYYNPLTKTMQLKVPKAERAAIKEKLPKQITDISFKIFDESFYAPSGKIPKDPGFSRKDLSWYFAPIQAYDAWEITTGDSEVKVAVIDSYFDMTHIELGGAKIRSPYNIVRKSADVAPPLGMTGSNPNFFHGSMTSSQAVGWQDNGAGLSGIAPGCTLIPVSIGDCMSNLTILEAILYAIYQDADVINLSLGTMFGEMAHLLPIEQQVIISKSMGLVEEDVWNYVFNMADERNVTIVWAAGNDDVFTAMDATKRNNNTIKVSALDMKLYKADFSNFGNISVGGERYEMSTISAPGVNIFGAMPWNTFNIGPGTSYSAPIVTGAVALMKSLDPSLSNAEIIKILQETGKPVSGPEGNTIGPMLQIKDALMRIKGGMAKSDEVLDDHSKLFGLWQSTRLVEQLTDGKKNGNYDRLYFKINNEKSGEIIVYTATTNKKEYHAPLTIKWESDKVTFYQKENATCPGEKNYFLPATYVCTNDDKGLLLVNETGDGYTDRYNIKRVKAIDKE